MLTIYAFIPPVWPAIPATYPLPIITPASLSLSWMTEFASLKDSTNQWLRVTYNFSFVCSPHSMTCVYVKELFLSNDNWEPILAAAFSHLSPNFSLAYFSSSSLRISCALTLIAINPIRILKIILFIQNVFSFPVPKRKMLIIIMC